MNGYTKRRGWCVISLIKRVKYCYFFFFFPQKHCVFQAHFCGTRDLFNGMKHKSLCISVKEKFSALSQRLDLISVSTNGGVFWLSVCDTAKHRIHLQNNCIHQNTLISDTLTLVTSASLLCSSQLSIQGYKIVHIHQLSVTSSLCISASNYVSANKHAAAHMSGMIYQQQTNLIIQQN